MNWTIFLAIVSMFSAVGSILATTGFSGDDTRSTKRWVFGLFFLAMFSGAAAAGIA